MPTISTTLNHPSEATTLGDLRRLTAHLPDATPLQLDNADFSQYPAPGVYLEAEDNAVVFTEILPVF